MLRSLVSGFSGLRTHVMGMDVVGNNIANVNTIGFKAGRASFQDVLSQTISGANSSTSGVIGGKNAVQIGLGSTMASVDTAFSQGGLDATSNQNDLAINGEGFFTLKNGEQRLFSRAGNFSFDVNGNYVNTSGLFVQGWTDRDPATGNIRTGGELTNISIPQGMALQASPTSQVDVSGNINSSGVVGTVHSIPMEIYDSLGDKTNVMMVLTKSASNTWSWRVSAASGTAAGSGSITFNTLGNIATGGGIQFTFNPATGAAQNQLVSVDLAGGSLANSSGLRQTRSQVSIALTNLTQNGYTAGELQSYLVDFNGTIRAFFDNGLTQEIAKVALTTFPNQGGLMRVGENLFSTTTNSGSGVVGESGTGVRGKIQPSSLEFSNVDLAEQFTRMIVLQRGFQANAKMVTTSDEMLQSLMTLKR